MSAVTPARSGAGTLTVDLGAVQTNYRRIAERVAPAECAGVVKADAYGLGAEQVGPALARTGCRTFFVALPAEAVRLREVLPEAMIYVLNGYDSGSEQLFFDATLRPVLNALSEVREWAAAARRRHARAPAAVHIDTGMARLGLTPQEVEVLAASPAILESFDLALVMSHLACADTPDHSMNRMQRERFLHLRALLPPTPASLANSAGCFLPSDYWLDLVRPGVSLYGGRPHPGRPPQMTPVVRIEATVLQVRSVPAGTPVGYGASERVTRPSRIATVAIGYADGYKRALSSLGTARISGTPVPVIGRVSMDLVTLDVTDLPVEAVYPGRPVEMLGDNTTIDDVAAAAGTIAHDVLTSLGHRFSRVYSGGRISQ